MYTQLELKFHPRMLHPFADKIIPTESVDDRIDRQLTYIEQLPNYYKRGLPLDKNPNDNIQALLYKQEGPEGHYIEKFFAGHNKVTDRGDAYYASCGARLTPNLNTVDANHNGIVNRMQLANPAVQINPAPKDARWNDVSASAIAGSKQPIDVGYPTVNDQDTNNPDRGVKVISWRRSYGLNDFTADVNNMVKNCFLHDIIGTATSTDFLLSLGTIDQFSKSNTDTVVFFINHAVLGQ